MSLVVTVYVPSGIVMAADSRMTVTRTEELDEDGQKVRQNQQLVLSDSAYKIVEMQRARVGMALYDAGIIDNEPADAHARRFEEEMLEDGDDAPVVAAKFRDYMYERHPGTAVGFHVAGFRREGRTSIPYVLVGHTTREPEIGRVNATERGDLLYGVTQSGDSLVAQRLIDQQYLPYFAGMPLQDAIDYAIHLIRTTIQTLRFEPRFPTVGGPIDVLAVQPDGMRWVQRKELRGS